MKTLPLKHLVTPNECLPLLKEQRTHYIDHKTEYENELYETLLSIYPFLPDKATNILDIGCGMAGISALISSTYNHDIQITLLDKHGVSPVINAGFNATADKFSHYNDFDLAKLLLKTNGVELDNVEVCDISTHSFPDETFDIVISLLSWGFHYPISTYTPKVRKNGGIIVCDVRKGTNGLKELENLGAINIVKEAEKYMRVIVQ